MVRCCCGYLTLQCDVVAIDINDCGEVAFFTYCGAVELGFSISTKRSTFSLQVTVYYQNTSVLHIVIIPTCQPWCLYLKYKNCFANNGTSKKKESYACIFYYPYFR